MAALLEGIGGMDGLLIIANKQKLGSRIATYYDTCIGSEEKHRARIAKDRAEAEFTMMDERTCPKQPVACSGSYKSTLA